MRLQLTLITAFTIASLHAQEDAPDKRLRHSAEVLREIMAAPDKGIPHDLLDRAQCVMVVPGMKKGAFLVGGEYGRGFAECRNHGHWSGPAAVRLSGGSFGPQIGVESTDVVMLVMDEKGLERLASDKFTVGGDASAAAGPVGRTIAADTDVSLRAEILTYSRSKGAFAGVSLQGTVVTQDGGENKKVYGHDADNHAILHGEVKDSTRNPLSAVLARYGGHHTKKS